MYKMGKYIVLVPFVLVFKVTMIIISVLALAVIADGYRLYNQSSSSVQNNVISLICEQNGSNSNVLEITSVKYLECMENKFGMKKFEREFREAQYNNSYEELFKKYCAKAPQLKVCYQTLLDDVSPCIGNTSELLISTTKKTMNRIIDFLCTDDGAIISRFSSEGGPQCFQSKIKEIIGCAVYFQSPTLNKDINITTTEANNSHIYHDSLTCGLQNLETCSNSVSDKVFKKIADTIHESVSEAIRDLIENFTIKQVFEQLNETQNVAVESDGHDNKFERQCGKDGVNCTTVQIQNSSDNATTNQVLAHVNDTQHEPDRSDDENKLQELCKKNGADLETLQDIVKQSKACMEDSVGIKMFIRDLKEAQNKTSYADVFKRYCPRAPLLKTCVHTLTHGVSHCFGDEAEDYRTTTMTAYDGIIDYVCQDDDFGIAKFLAEGGPRCLKNKSQDIRRCAKESKNTFIQGWEITLSVTQIYGMENQLLDCILKSVASCNPEVVKTIESVAAIIRNSYSHDSKKIIPEKKTRNLVKASGTVVLAFNVDIFV